MPASPSDTATSSASEGAAGGDSAASTTSSAAPATPAVPLPCPRCGYDLRGTTSDRCSECGQPVDRAALAESGLPWAQRKKLGHAGAFRKTVWLIAFDSKRIRQELSKPQDVTGARAFRTRLTILVSFSGLAIFIAVLFLGRPETAFDHFDPYNRSMTGWQQDLLVPWMAGIGMVWPVPLCIVLLAIYLTGLPMSAIRLSADENHRRQAAEAMARYAAAPLAWIFWGAVLVVLTFLFVQMTRLSIGESRTIFETIAFFAALFGVVISAIALLLPILRAADWIGRVHHGGMSHFLLAAAECLVRFLIGIVVCAFAVPWCLGMIWIAIDSLR